MMKKNNNCVGCAQVFARFVRIAACTMFATLSLFGSLVSGSYAGSGTWIPNPVNNDWNTAANWSCECVPGGPFDTATFGVSHTPQIALSGETSLFSMVFNVGASAYEITSTPGNSFSIVGNGISNDSNAIQTFMATTDGSGTSGSFGFGSGGTAGKLTTFTTEGPTTGGGVPALVQFSAGANAGSPTIINKGGVLSGAGGGETDFFNNSKADTAEITNKAGVESGASGGTLTFWNGAGAANSIITSEGATVIGAAGGKTRFIEQSNAGNATLVANGGLNGGTGGVIQFENDSTGDTAQVKVFGNGSLNISVSEKQNVTIGSLEGNGEVVLGTRKLSVGSNNLTTAFSGVIQDTGSLIKIGAGTLTLSGANTYAGGTTVSAGGLKASNKSGSATGSGAVQVNSSTLSGKGTITGAVTIGTGSGAGAFLAPRGGAGQPAKLTIQSALTLKADGTYTYALSTRKAKADQVVANGVTIESGAQFNFIAVGNKRLTAGAVFTAISNTSATPISGAFANLADESTITAGRNTYQVDYQGGDGNDLTLTVVP